MPTDDKMSNPKYWGTRRTVLEVTEEWEASVGGGAYHAPKGETPSDWEVTADMFPKSLGDDPRLAGLVGITLEGPCRNVLPLLKHMVQLIELIDEDFKKRGDVAAEGTD